MDEQVFLGRLGTAFRAARAWLCLLIREPSSAAWQNRVASPALLECWRMGECLGTGKGGPEAKWMTFRYTK